MIRWVRHDANADQHIGFTPEGGCVIIDRQFGDRHRITLVHHEEPDTFGLMHDATRELVHALTNDDRHAHEFVIEWLRADGRQRRNAERPTYTPPDAPYLRGDTTAWA